MQTTKTEWTGTVMLSEGHYDHKPTYSECTRMKFLSTTVDLDSLSGMICDGYSFCPTQRRKDMVEDSNMIVIDIDGSDIPMNDFVKSLAYEPSVCYTTFSNGKYGDHKYRFRLIYAIEGHTSGVNSYNAVFEYIVGKNRLRELLPDTKSVDKLQANQMYHGSYECEIRNTGLVYKVPDVLLVNTDIECKCTKGNHISPETERMFLKHRRIGEFISEYESLNGVAGVLTETPYIPSDIEGMLVPACEYMCVPRKYGWFDQKAKNKVYVKWKDGENRHGKLWLAGLVMRKLNNYLSEDELFYGFVKYIYCNIDLFNSDRSIKYTREKIIEEFNSVMDVDMSLFSIKNEVKHSSFKVDPLYCLKNGISKREALCEINTIRWQQKKEKKYELIDSMLSKEQILSMTNKQCVEFLLDNGLKISSRTFSNYLSERNINKRSK